MLWNVCVSVEITQTTWNVLQGVPVMLCFVSKIALHVHDDPRIFPLDILSQSQYMIRHKIKLFLGFFTSGQDLRSDNSDLSTQACKCNKCVVARRTPSRLV